MRVWSHSVAANLQINHCCAIKPLQYKSTRYYEYNDIYKECHADCPCCVHTSLIGIVCKVGGGQSPPHTPPGEEGGWGWAGLCRLTHAPSTLTQQVTFKPPKCGKSPTCADLVYYHINYINMTCITRLRDPGVHNTDLPAPRRHVYCHPGVIYVNGNPYCNIRHLHIIH